MAIILAFANREKAKALLCRWCAAVWIADPEEVSISVLFPDGTKWFFSGDTEIVDSMLPDLGLNTQTIFQEAELV